MIDGKALLAEVRANLAKLDGCAGPHDFKPIEPREHRLFGKLRCEKCGGQIQRSDYIWYERGLKHGSQNAQV